MKSATLCLFFILSLNLYSSAQQVQSAPTVDDIYRKKIGNLRMSKSTINFRKIKNNEIKTDTIQLYNVGKSDMTIALASKLPAFLKVDIGSATLKPEEKTYVLVTYDASKRNDYGMVFDRFAINTNDADQPQKFFNLSAVIQEYFPPAAEGDTTIVKAVVTETVFDFGQIKQGEKTSKTFSISNSGSKKLLVRSVKNTCGCIKTTLSKNEILPGESASLRIDYDSFAKEGKDQKFVTVYLNDPLLSEVKFDVHGEVIK